MAWRSGRHGSCRRSAPSWATSKTGLHVPHPRSRGILEHIAGHITWQRDGQDTLLVNPWGLWWNEITASDLCTVDMDANVVAGKWDVTPAIHIHTELHRRRRDARVVIHNHPYSVCVMASLGRLPELLHQTGTMYDEDMVLISEYGGEIDSRALGAELADQIGTANVIILGNHGAIVTGSTIEEATFRAAALDRACRLAYDVLVTGLTPLSIPRYVIPGIKASLIERGSAVYFAGAVRSCSVANQRCCCDHGLGPGRGRHRFAGRAFVISLDDLTSNRNFTKGGRDGERTVTFLPDPPAAERKYTVISADDHIVEPPHVFENRVPQRFADRAPGSSRKRTGARRGSTTVLSFPTSGSTRWSVARSRSGGWSRPASTRCGGAPGTSTSEFMTWTSTGSTPR